MQSVLADTTKSQTEHKLEKVRLQLKWVHEFNFAGYVAAVEKGFYREAGLDVELIEGKPGVNFFEEVLSGKAEYGVEMSEILLERNKGKPLVVIAAIFQHSPQIFLMREDSGIKSPQDLIGRRVMWRFDSAAELGATLKNEGVDNEDIEFVELSWDINDLIDKKVDAVHAYMTAQPFVLEQRGVAYTFIRPITYGVDFYGDCLFTTEKEIREHSERVKAFRQASLRGWDYAMKNPEELIDIIITKYGSKASRTYMLNEWEIINTLMLPTLVEIGHMNQGRWKHIGDTFVKLGMLKPDYALKGFMYDPNPEPDYKWAYWTIGIIGVILLIVGLSVVILIFFNLRLKKEVRLQTLELSETNQKLVKDITERRKAETDRERLNKELKQKNRELEQVVYVASHDLRSPLINIDGYSNVVGTALKEIIALVQNEKLPTEIKEKINARVENDIVGGWHHIDVNVKKMGTLLSGLLEVSRLGRVEIHNELLDMNKVISDVAESISFELQESGTNLEISKVPSCICDRNQMSQIFSNLIGNAIQNLTPERQGIIKVSGYTENGSIVYCVEDNGIGIAPEHHEKIFNLFYRLNPSKYMGDGIGLTIIHKILHQHGGKIWIESEQGKGSKFFVSLPA